MASFRAVLTIGRVHPGGDAQGVLPAAADAVAALTTVESRSVGVARGRAQVTVRFSADDGDEAKRMAAAAVEAAWHHAEVLDVQVRRQVGTRWPLV